MGTNASSFALGGSIMSDGVNITPTGYGYAAAAGYDHNERARYAQRHAAGPELTHIAHHQMSFDRIPSLIEGSTDAGWTSGANQTFLIQARPWRQWRSSLTLGNRTIDFDDTVAATYAWTSRFAEQVMQDNFDPNLVRLFDKQAMGWVGSFDVAAEPRSRRSSARAWGWPTRPTSTSPSAWPTSRRGRSRPPTTMV